MPSPRGTPILRVTAIEALPTRQTVQIKQRVHPAISLPNAEEARELAWLLIREEPIPNVSVKKEGLRLLQLLH